MCMGANVAILAVRPCVEETSVGTRNEQRVVTSHGCRELFDFFPMPSLGPLVDRFAVCRPMSWLCVQVEEDRRQTAMPVRALHLGPERERMLDELRGIQMSVASWVAAQTVANAFVPCPPRPDANRHRSTVRPAWICRARTAWIRYRSALMASLPGNREWDGARRATGSEFRIRGRANGPARIHPRSPAEPASPKRG